MRVGVGEGQLAVPPGGHHSFPPWMEVFSTQALDVGAVRRVLVVRTDHLGDLVLSTPFLEALRRNLPRAHITALVTPYTRPVLERNPSVDEVEVIEREAGSRKRSAFLKGLRDEDFDAVIALSPTTKGYAIARTAKAPVRAGYIYSRRWVPRALSGVLLSHRAVYHIDSLVEKQQPVPHEVEQTLWFARMLGLSVDAVPLRLYPDAEEMASMCASLGQGAQPFVASRAAAWDAASRRECPWLAVQLSPAWMRPPWKLVNFVELLSALREGIPEARLVVVYGPQEEKWGEELQGSTLTRVMGKLNLSRWAGLMGAARIVISPDTGGLHVAAAMRTPVVGVYEESTFALCSQQWSPWMVPHRKVVKSTPVETIPRIVAAAKDLWKPGR